MQIIPNATGWQETITVQVDIKRIRTKAMRVGEWTQFNKGHPKIAEQRERCGCCGVSWSETQTIWVNMVHLANGAAPRPICDNCLILISKTFKGRIV